MTVRLAVAGDVFNGVLFLCCPFSCEISLVRSGTELSKFLRIFLPILIYKKLYRPNPIYMFVWLPERIGD